VDLTRGPQTGDVAVLQGFAIPPQSGGSIGLLTLVAVIPWPSGGTAAPDVFAMSTPDDESPYTCPGDMTYCLFFRRFTHGCPSGIIPTHVPPQQPGGSQKVDQENK
jgi:hypothetical protein